MDKLSLLKSVFVFGGLEESLLVKISAHLKNTEYAQGTTVFKQDGTADAFYIVDKGEVLISKKLGPGQEKALALLGPASVFGEMAFFSDSPRTASATAKSDTVLWKIERSDFMKFISEEPKAGLRILSGLLQVSMDRLEQTSRELATIYHTGTIISSGRRLEEILKGITDELLLAIPEAEDSAVYIYNEFNDEFDPLAAGPKATQIPVTHALVKHLKEKPGGSILATVESIVNVRVDIFADAVSLLVSPIIKESKLLGFTALWSTKIPHAFRSGQLLLAATVSSQLAEAIENVRHQQEERDRQRLRNAKDNY